MRSDAMRMFMKLFGEFSANIFTNYVLVYVAFELLMYVPLVMSAKSFLEFPLQRLKIKISRFFFWRLKNNFFFLFFSFSICLFLQ